MLGFARRTPLRRGKTLLLASSMLVATAVPGLARAGAPVLPTGGRVVSGTAVIGAASGGALSVSQSSAKAILDWSSFSIGKGGAVSFQNGSGAALNRVTGGASVSSIDGLLSATGSVYLINPNGVIIGKSGVVNVGGTFVASTLDVADKTFLAGGSLGFVGASNAAVVNYGKVGALGGDVALIAAKVENDGSITAANGTAGLVSGYSVVLRDAALDDGRFAVLAGGSGTSVTNTGAIAAANAELRAEQGNIYALAGNTAGVIRATGVKSGDGHIWLKADGGTLQLGGVLEAQGPGGSSGAIETSGETVDIGKASIDAHGGAWLIDPDNLTVDAGAAATISSALNSGPYGTSVTLQTALYGASGPGVSAYGAGDIIVGAPIAWSKASTLTLDAYHGVTVNAPISISGPGGLVVATNDGGAGGTFTVAQSIDYGATDKGGTLVINTLPYTLLYSLGALDAVDGLSAVDGSALSAPAAGLAGNYALASNLVAPSGVTYAHALVAPNTHAGATPGTFNSAAFRGVIEGLGHTISGVTISSADSLVGLVGGSTGTIENLGLVGGQVSGVNVGSLVGETRGAVFNVFSSATVAGQKGTGSAYDTAGGLIGINSGSVSSAYATGPVSGVGPGESASNSGAIGGLIGSNAGIVANVYATGNVSASGDFADVGGLIGSNAGSLAHAYATGAVSYSGEVGGAGGLVGLDTGPVSNAYATGSVSVSSEDDAGGLAEYVEGAALSNVYALGAVTGTGGDGIVGGLVGVLLGSTVTDGYAAGAVSAVSGGNARVGGAIASQSNGTAVGVYYDSQTAGVTNDGAGAVAQTTAQLQGVLPSGFSSGAWATGPGLFPYLTAIDPNGVRAISGIAYSDAGRTPLASSSGIVSVAPAIHAVSAFVGGSSVGQASTGADGYFYLQTPATAGAAGVAVAAYTTADDTAAGPVTGLRLASLSGTATNFDIWGRTLIAPTADTTLAAARTDGATPSALLAANGGADQALLTAATGGAASTSTLTAVGYVATDPSGFALDAGLPTQGLYVQTTAGPITVPAPLSVYAGQTLTLRSAGAIAVDATVSVEGTTSSNGGAVNLYTGYDTTSLAGVPLAELSFAPGASIDYGSTNHGGALSINGASYGLLYSLQDIDAIDGVSAVDGSALTAPAAGLGGTYALATSLTAPTSAYAHALVAPDGSAPYTGTFEGLGHSVSGLTITSADNEVALFGQALGAVRDLGLVGGSVSSTGRNDAGALVGLAGRGLIVNDFASTAVAATQAANLGGLVGADGYIVGCYATGVVNGLPAPKSSRGAKNVGGLAGTNDMTILDSYATGAVQTSGAQAAGGLVGMGAASIAGAYATGAVSAGDMTYVGGLVGDSNGAIANAYANGAVSGGVNAVVGGLVGLDDGSVSDAYASGAVSGGAGAKLGGLVGKGGTITAGYYDAGVSGQPLGQQANGSVGLSTAAAANPASYAGFSFGALGSGASWAIVDGDGTINGANGATRPFLLSEYATVIGNAHQLQLMALDPTATYTLAGLVDATATANASGPWLTNGFAPIGGPSVAFTGTLDGQSQIIENLHQTPAAGASYVGLFGVIGAGGVVDNLIFDNTVTAVGGAYVGRLAGVNDGSIINVRAQGAVGGAEYVGGLVGWNDTTGVVIGSASPGFGAVAATGDYAGGIAGVNKGLILNASSSGPVSGVNQVGGVVGLNQGVVNGAETDGAVDGSVSGASNVGGLVGWNDTGGAIIAGSQDQTVTATGSFSGGIVGVNYGAISGATSYAKVQGNQFAGGFVGWNATGGSITNSKVLGSVSGSEYVGGFAGWNSIGVLTSDAAQEGVTATGDYAGGFVGVNQGLVSSVKGDSYVQGASIVGGLVGLNQGQVAVSEESMSVNGTSMLGGLVGYNDTRGTIDDSVAHGEVTGDPGYGGDDDVGGLVGVNYGSIANAYATGDVSGTNVVGGLVGANQGGARVTAAYALGAVTASGAAAGTLFGVNAGEVTYVYGFPELSGQALLVGYQAPSATSSGTALTTDQETDPTAYQGFDFVNHWVGPPYGPPFLQLRP